MLRRFELNNSNVEWKKGYSDDDSTCLARCQARRRKSRLADSSGRPLSVRPSTSANTTVPGGTSVLPPPRSPCFRSPSPAAGLATTPTLPGRGGAASAKVGRSARYSGRSSLARSVARRSAPTATSRRASVPETTTPTAKSPGLGSYLPPKPAPSSSGGALRLRTNPADIASSRWRRAGLASAACRLGLRPALAKAGTRRGCEGEGETGKRRPRGAAAAAIAGGIFASDASPSLADIWVLAPHVSVSTKLGRICCGPSGSA
uniref:Uncharacterized protein n=1 Tax=Oryza meridionalis TaxID=40149 RepID=A0A0E0C426_9ORYZ